MDDTLTQELKTDILVSNDIKKESQLPFTEIVDLYQVKVRGICIGFLKNREEAEDVSQEVFIEVYRSLKNFKGECALSTWIYHIATSKSIDNIRKKNRKKRFALFNRNIEPDETEYHNGTEYDAERNERINALYKTMAMLSENQRIALTLNKIEGFSYKEISQIMKTTPKAVESLISRGKGNMRKKLETHYNELF
ncbi:MAG: RNA polymerase sigma factor [Ignavibacteria bacterium]|nr:RNA polymerase sigma factor [Ignavibacteria bacterium]